MTLLTSLSSATNNKGDAVRAEVVSPEILRGDILTGVIRALGCTNTSSGDRTCVVSFSFDALTHREALVLPVVSALQSVVNSRGRPEQDEDGYAVQKAGNPGNVAAGAAFVELSNNGARISFAPGSRFTVWLSLGRARQ